MDEHSHEDLWGYISGLREDLGAAESRIHDLEDKLAKRDEVMSVHGELLDKIRNRVYDLEHGTPPRRHRDWDDDGE